MKANKIIGIITSLSIFVCMSVLGVSAADNSTNFSIATNEGNATVWIFAGIIAILAIAGIVYFIIQNKNNKK